MRRHFFHLHYSTWLKVNSFKMLHTLKEEIRNSQQWFSCILWILRHTFLNFNIPETRTGTMETMFLMYGPTNDMTSFTGMFARCVS